MFNQLVKSTSRKQLLNLFSEKFYLQPTKEITYELVHLNTHVIEFHAFEIDTFCTYRHFMTDRHLL